MIKCSKCGDSYNENVNSKCPNCGNDSWTVGNSNKSSPNKSIGIFFCIIALVVIAIFVIHGINKKKVSDEVYETGAYVIKVVDLYLDGSATREETKEKIREINLLHGDDEELREISFEIEFLETGLTTNDIPKIKKYRDDIADIIGY